MIIKDISENIEILFENVRIGEVFKFDNRVFMKVSSDDTGNTNSYDFTKSRLTNISSDTLVRYIPSELILHEKNWDLDK